jgi:DNA-binding response OmpR family regulator
MTDTRILVADDSNTIRTLVSTILTRAGYEVVVAHDGTDAVEKARLHHPHLAVLDIVMPELDGYGVCERLKEMGTPWCEIPIVFLTSVKSQALKVLGSEFGAYLNKPVNVDELLRTIEQNLARCAG